MSMELITASIRLAGLGQLILSVASLAIPKVLGWKEELTKVRRLTRQVFWTYAIYIWSTNVAFGLVSLFGADWLLDHSPLAACLTGFITIYWAGRCGIQWFYFDRSEAPVGFHVQIAEYSLNLLFVLLTGTYSWATWWNLSRVSP